MVQVWGREKGVGKAKLKGHKGFSFKQVWPTCNILVGGTLQKRE